MVSAKHLRGLAVLLALGSAAAGCQSHDVTVGEQPANNAALYPQSLECVSGDPYEPEVDWEGYVEASTSELAAQRVRIREPQGEEDGFVLFGSGPQLPEATDPEEGWPCPDMGGDFLLPGFPYTIQHAFVTDFRMQFRIAAYEPMDGWCALQTDSATVPGTPDICTPSEIPDGGVIFFEGSEAIRTLCQWCTCDSAGCRAKVEDELEPTSRAGDVGVYYTFDIGVDGDRADGFVKNLLPDISSPIGTNLQHARFQRAE